MQRERGLLGEVGLYGGAVMCMVLNARDSTHDIDAIFNPKTDIRQIVNEMICENNWAEGWFNDAVKGFISNNNNNNNNMRLVETLSNLKIYAASPEYIFSMKCLSCRTDNKNEISDIKFLANYIGIKMSSKLHRLLVSTIH